MDDSINVNKKDPQLQIKIGGMLYKDIRIPYNYPSKIGYDTLIWNVILIKMMNLMGTIIIDIE